MTATLSALARGIFTSLLGSLSRAAGTANSAALDLATLGYEGVALITLDAAAPGASGTLDLALQESDDNSVWTAVPLANVGGGAFTQVTAAGGASVQSRYIDLGRTKRYLRAVGTGVTAATVYSVGFIAQAKYQS